MTAKFRFATVAVASAISITSLLLALSNPAYAQGAANDQDVIEEIVVISARLRADSVQDTPIAISAFGADTLAERQIENVSDIQFNVPSFSYSKDNFTTSAFQIRGIGQTAIGSTADSGISVHVNDLPIESHRLYASEFFDIETVEVMRGPQGTLFGRNATGGLLNTTTVKPVNQFEANFVAELGDFNSRHFKGMINFPMGDTFSARFAGISSQRDGYTTNQATGNDIDGRDMYSVRGTLRWEPTDRTTIDLMAQYMDEDSNRSRSQKKLCHRDPVGNLGCLGDTLEFEFPNGMAQLPYTLVSNLVLGDPTNLDPILNQGLSLLPFGYDVNSPAFGGAANPTDMRTVNWDFEPIYEADDTLVTLTLDQAIGDSQNLTISIGRHETSYYQRQDWDGTVTAPIIGSPVPGTGLPVILPLLAPLTTAALYSNGNLPLSNISGSFLGVLGLDILDARTNSYTYDQSNTVGEQTTVEAILTSDFDGPVNYLLGAIWFDYEGSTDYNLAANTIDYFATAGTVGSVSPLFDGAGVATTYFVNETDLYGLESTGLFGELYWDITDTVELTLGLRYTSDEKRVRDRNLLFNTLLTPPPPLFIPVPTPIGSTSANGLPPYRTDSETFTATTGRIVLNWAFSDQAMLYGSYSRGYKGGGFNPPFDPVLFPNASRTFEPEDVNAFEIGLKSEFADGRVTANLTAFYYDYKGLQISRIVNRTSFNDNVDSEISGFEAELFWAATDDFLINATLSLLNTEIGDVVVADPRDPAAGIAESTVIKDILTSNNCVLLWNGGPDPTTLPPSGDPALDGLLALLPFSDCGVIESLIPAFNGLGLPYSYTDAVEKDVSGNPLVGSPETSYNIGAQYTFHIGNFELTPRVDYYWQDDSQARIYDSAIDQIDSWDIINAQITLTPADAGWYVRVFVQNAADDDNITGMFLDDAAVGLSTNVFLLEPRRYGAAFGIYFD